MYKAELSLLERLDKVEADISDLRNAPLRNILSGADKV